jgi:hypothetical protein
MTDLLDVYERQLVEASKRLTRPPRVPRRPSWRGIPRAAVVALALVLVATPALAALAPWHAVLGDDQRGHPTQAADQPPAEQRALLGILRRPQSMQDRGPAVQAALRLVGRQVHGVRSDAIRFLAPGPDGVAITLVPVQRFGDDAAGVHTDTPDALCVVYPLAQGAGATFPCMSTQDIMHGQPRPIGEGGHEFGLAPDSVARVTVHYADGSTASAAVHDNFYELPAPTASPVGSKLEWQGHDGTGVGPPLRDPP